MTWTLFNGTWTAAESPLPADAAMANHIAVLDAIACTALGSCTAVGQYTDASGSSQGLVETLADGTWVPAKAPLPSGATAVKQTASLNGIACTAPGSCTAVGQYTDASGSSQGLVETLADGTWVPAKAPLPSGATAVKQTASLNGIACTAPGSCTAVGQYTDRSDNGQGLVESLVNGSWTPVKAPLPRNAAGTRRAISLRAVACMTNRSCVAVGSYTDANSDTQALIETAA